MNKNSLNEVFVANIRWNGLKIEGGHLTPSIHYPFLETICSNKSLEDIIEKAIIMIKTDIILDYEENEYYNNLEYDIEIIHTIFSKSDNDDELSYEDFVYKYGPVKHKINLDGKIYLSEFADETKFDYYSDIYNKESKYKVGENCNIFYSNESFTDKMIGSGIIIGEKSNMFDYIDNLDQFQSGYFLKGIDINENTRSFVLIGESNLIKQ